MPLTLHSDLVRLAKLAKLGQSGVADGVRACCAAAAGAPPAPAPAGKSGKRSGGPADPLAAYVTGLEAALAAAVVNVTAITEAVEGRVSGGTAAAAAGASGGSSGVTLEGGLQLETAPLVLLYGKLLNNGGIRGCKVRGCGGGGRATGSQLPARWCCVRCCPLARINACAQSNRRASTRRLPRATSLTW